MPITFEQAEILGHSLGVNLLHAKQSTKKRDKKLPKEFYRNRFCAGDGHNDLPTLQALENLWNEHKKHHSESRKKSRF